MLMSSEYEKCERAGQVVGGVRKMILFNFYSFYSFFFESLCMKMVVFVKIPNNWRCVQNC